MSNPCLLSSSIGKKFLMSITGLFFVLFLAFHATMNAVHIFSPEAYNAICEFLGANWYALVGTGIIALGFIIHIAYATILTIQNRKARGTDRYDSEVRPASVEWASKNMFALGVIVFLGLGLHLYMFWSKMQLAEIMGTVDAIGDPADGSAFIMYWFSKPWVVVVYMVWLVAIWFHLTHGFWSAFQTMGLNNKTWMSRLRCLSDIIATIICVAFAAVVIAAFCMSL
ncbi:MAG: succinate dehydrogenase/fumarate reductase cytochrome b subunit [Bacteroidales bacterium]|nr:succinate dehydrogenase/fumarate reductase cytochrome b subunit [Bacteroidales bacterium]